MARQEVDIGIEGNDGTGDSIRESFKKVNQNFTELYAVFGLGGTIAFKTLDDVPDSYLGNTNAIPAVNSTETAINFYKFVSDALDNGDTNLAGRNNNSVVVTLTDPVDQDNDSGTLKIEILDPHIERDPDPRLTAPLNAEGPIAYSNIVNTKLRASSGDDINSLVTDWNTTHSSASDILPENILVSKGYVDDSYVNITGDTLTGHLSTIAGATGTQVPQVQEVITRAGSKTNRTMLDDLYLADHPYPLQGSGTPNDEDDLLAVSKLYVDTQGFSSSTNLYVTTTGDDAQTITPAGQEGRSPQYAYKTINAAMARAEQIIEATPYEPGPYVQIITHSEGTTRSLIDSVAGRSSPPATSDAASTLILDNLNQLQEDVKDYIAQFYPDLVYDTTTCLRDVKLILNSVRLDVLGGTGANSLSRWAGLRYNANPSAIKARTLQYDATNASIVYLGSQVANLFATANTGTPGTVSASVISAYADKFTLITDIIDDGEVPGSFALDAGTTYTFDFANGSNSSVDQGVAGNSDLIEGKIIQGRSSGAKGVITEYTRAATGSTDRVSVELLEPIDFIAGEELEYGNITRNNQITVRVESGLYYEHFPIKLPENVSIKGDEFRRVIIRPKSGVSQSKWANTYFYRDINIDGLIGVTSPIATITGTSVADASRAAGTYTVSAGAWGSDGIGEGAEFEIVVDGLGAATVTINNGGNGFIIGEKITIPDDQLGTGGAADLTFNVGSTGGGYNFTHPVTSKQGKYGRHYLINPNDDVDVSAFGATNPGGFTNGARLVELNKSFIVEEVIEYINATYPSLVYNETKCRRDTGLIVDGLVLDLRLGGRENSLTNQGAYYEGSVTGQETETEAAIAHIKLVTASVVLNTAFPSTLGSVSQVIDTDYTVEAEAQTNIDALVDCINYAFDSGYNPPKNNSEMDVFLCNDGTIVRNCTVQQHGGFMMVLDPEGQILTRSPYCQTGSSFSRSKGAYRSLAGGMFADGYAGNMPASVDAVDTAYRIQISSPAGEGLFVKKPQTPFPIYYDGARYTVNTIEAYSQSAGTATLVLDETSNPADVTIRTITAISKGANTTVTTGSAHGLTTNDLITVTGVSGMTQLNGNSYYVDVISTTELRLYNSAGPSSALDSSTFGTYTSSGQINSGGGGQGWTSGTGVNIFLQSGGNRSMLSNDFTQINDLGYGALLVNNALAELVSMFTYYCHTGYMAKDGSQIRSLGGNNSYGFYGLVADGSDPDEIASQVNLGADMVQPVKVFRADNYLNFSGAVTGTITEGQTLKQGEITAGISGATAANPVRITANTHNLTNNDQITISLVNGMTELNNRIFYVDVIDPNNFDLYTDSALTSAEDGTGHTAYISGGQAVKTANATGVISFFGEGASGRERIYVHSSTGTFNTTSTCTTSSGTAGIPTEIENLDLDAETGDLFAYAYDMDGYPNNVSEIEILHSTGLYQPYEVTNAEDTGFRLGSYSIDTSTVSVTGTYTSNDAVLKIYKDRANNYSVEVESGGTGAAASETIIIDGTDLGGATSTNDATVTIDTVDSGAIVTASITGTPLFDDTSPVKSGQVWKFNFGTGIEGTAENGIQVDTLHNTVGVFRHKQNFLLDNFPGVDPSTRPSTAFQFTDDTTDLTYRTIGFSNTITDGVNTLASQRMVTFDSNFNYIDLTVDQTSITTLEGSGSLTVDPNYTDIIAAAAPPGTRTLGNTIGDIFIAINPLDEQAQSRLAGGEMIFTWGGKVHTIDAYAEYDLSGSTIAVIGIGYLADSDINFPASATGLARTVALADGLTLKAGLVSGEEATITVNISTCRATGHDMLDIGTGGFNTSNYPDRIFGRPFGTNVVSSSDAIDENGTASAAQASERRKGRVFAVLTDQDGFFRVGRFFTVDQGTGSVTFNAALVLTNIDGIGFKRGVRINEFSNDDSFTDAKGDAVPTQTAVEGYIDSRLGFNRDGGVAGVTPIGPGVMSLGGPGFTETPMNDDMNMGSNRIINVANPLTGADAATKDYVDNATDNLNDIGDVSIQASPSAADLLIFTGTLQDTENATLGGDVTFSRVSANTLTAAITGNVIVNADINTAAAIEQSKLSMRAADTNATAPGSADQTVLGLARFDSGSFTATNGWIEITDGGIANAKLANNDITIGSTTISLGGTSSSLAGMTGITFTSGDITSVANITHTGNITGGANSGADNGQAIGSTTNKYNAVWATTFHGTATEALYADLAENYLGDADYEPGTVVVFGGDAEVTVCSAKGQTSVAGVVTTDPAHLMNSALEGDHVVGLALQGRVPCKVIGTVKKGDMLVTSAVPGYAIVNNSPGVGEVLGKAVGTKDTEDRGVVEIVVGRV